MFIKLIQTLRRKPKVVRDNIALGAAGSLTALVLVSWLVLDGVTPVNVGGVVAEGEAGVGAFSTLFGEVRDQTASLGEVFSDWRAQNEVVTEEPVSLDLPTLNAGPVSETTTTSTSTETETTRTIRIATTTSETQNPEPEGL